MNDRKSLAAVLSPPLPAGRRRAALAALALAAVAAAALAASRASSSTPPSPSGTSLNGSPVHVRLVDRPDLAAGTAPWVAATLAPLRRATLSTRLSASVHAVAADEGAKVSAGQLLVSLSDTDVRAQLAAAQTALDAAAANERRYGELAAQRAATDSELEMARSQRQQAAAGVAAARAALSYTEIRAPFAGTVQARRVNAGDLVGPGQPLVEIEGEALELQATLSDGEAEGLAVGRELRFRAGEATGRARLTALSPGGDPLSHRRSLRALVIADPRALLRSGSFARLELPAAAGPARPGATWVPRSALVRRGDLTGLFVHDQGKALLRWVALGEPAGELVPVRAGLEPGEQVIDQPGALRDGQAVLATEVARVR